MFAHNNKREARTCGACDAKNNASNKNCIRCGLEL
jgi:uncharacterized paraquat-inducible protein A